MFSDLGLYHDMDTVDKLNFYTENKEWKVTNLFKLPIIAFGILVVCDFALVFALAPISPLFCPCPCPLFHSFIGEIEGKGKGKKVT